MVSVHVNVQSEIRLYVVLNLNVRLIILSRVTLLLLLLLTVITFELLREVKVVIWLLLVGPILIEAVRVVLVIASPNIIPSSWNFQLLMMWYTLIFTPRHEVWVVFAISHHVNVCKNRLDQLLRLEFVWPILSRDLKQGFLSLPTLLIFLLFGVHY